MNQKCDEILNLNAILTLAFQGLLETAILHPFEQNIINTIFLRTR